jgi:type IV secretion system protein VirB8
MMSLISKFFKKDAGASSEGGHEQKVHKSWYADRYENLITQRNILGLLTILSFIAVVASIIVVGKISISKTFSPFVIQIEERTGSAKIVNPVNSDLLSGNEALSQYFIKKYLIARETYNPVDFDRNMRTVVRVMSSPFIYRTYLGFIRNPINDPTIIYAQKNTTDLRVKSFSRLGNQYFIRFSIIESMPPNRVIDKIATVTIEYLAMELNEQEREINPVGFQVTGYRVDDDRS